MPRTENFLVAAMTVWISLILQTRVCESVRLSVCLSVRPSRSGIRWKRRNVLSKFLHHTVAQSFRLYTSTLSWHIQVDISPVGVVYLRYN